MSTLLSTDKSLRKSQPMARGLLDYFPRALAAVSNVSFVANEQHNPGEEMHWAKEKSTDHADCIIRHMVDRGRVDDDGLRHSAKLAWRALALLETELDDALSPPGDKLVWIESGLVDRPILASDVRDRQEEQAWDVARKAYAQKLANITGEPVDVTPLGPGGAYVRTQDLVEPEAAEAPARIRHKTVYSPPDRMHYSKEEWVMVRADYEKATGISLPADVEEHRTLAAAEVAYTAKATQVYGDYLDKPFVDEITLGGELPYESKIVPAFAGHMMAGTDYLPAEPESTGHTLPPPLDIVDDRDDVHGTAVGDEDACGTTDGTTPIEYRFNTSKDARSEGSGCREHWIVRGGKVFFQFGIGGVRESETRLDTVQRFLADGFYVLCDAEGRAL